MSKVSQEIKSNPMYRYLLLLAVTATAGLQTWRSLYNNFAVDVVGIDGFQTGVIQSVRELPGFLSLLVVYLLLVIKEHRLSALAIVVMGVGILTTGIFPTYYGLIFTTFVMSLGFHYFEATNQSLVLQNFEHREAPIVLGRFRSIAAVANIVVGLVIIGAMRLSENISMQYMYYAFGLLTIGAGIYSLIKKVEVIEKPKKKKIILKKKYILYYLLNFFAGARRQIFVVFAVFLLVEKYSYPVEWIAALFVINNLVAYFLNPFVAKMINKFGERKILRIEYFFMIFIFIGYAYVDDKWLAGGLYIADHIFFSFAMAIKTYMQKTTEPEEIPANVAVGFTINHISAVVVPVFGGFLYLSDPKYAFFAGVTFAICSLILTTQMKKPEHFLKRAVINNKPIRIN